MNTPEDSAKANTSRTLPYSTWSLPWTLSSTSSILKQTASVTDSVYIIRYTAYRTDLGECLNFFFKVQQPLGSGASSLSRFRDHTHFRHTTFGRTQNSQQTNIYAPGGFEPETPASAWLQTHALTLCDHWDRQVSKILAVCVVQHRRLTDTDFTVLLIITS